MQITLQQVGLIVLGLWFVMFLAGTYQQNRIKNKILKRIDSGIEEALKKNSELTIDEYYQTTFADWDDFVRSNAWFILNKTEFLPVLAKPESVKKRFNFTAIWLGAYLRFQGYRLEANNEQNAAIDAIIEAAPAYMKRARAAKQKKD